MKWISSIVFFLCTVFVSGQQILEQFDSFDGVGEWTSPGLANTGSHSGELCFNITGTYTNGEFYVFQSPIYDFSSWSTVDLLWSQESDIRTGDLFALYFYDGGWFYYDISNLNGTYIVSLPTTTIAIAFVLDAGGTGSLNNKYSHVGFLDISDPVALPIELLSFSAEPVQDGVIVEWSTASQINNDYFSVERSTDAYEWWEMIRINGAGNANTQIDYTWLDVNPVDGTSYYRLKQTDYDGESETFNPVSVTIIRKKPKLIKKTNIMGQDVNDEYRGIVIEYYSDNTFRKTIQ